jgi:hypothetical protein
LLLPLTTENIGRADLTVLHDYAPGALLANMARILFAYNPWIRTPPDWDSLISDPVSGLTLGTTLDEAFASPAAYGLKMEAGSTDTWLQKNKTWVIMADALGYSGPATSRQVRFRDSVLLTSGSSSIERLLSGMNGGDMQKFGPGHIDGADGGPKLTVEEVALMRLMLALDWAPIVESGYFTQVPAPPEGVRREAYGRMVRAYRLATILQQMACSLRAFPLKPVARLLQLPSVAAQARLEWGVKAEDVFETFRQLEQLPLHRVLARADALSLPGRALTPWAATSEVRGLPRFWAEKARTKRTTLGLLALVDEAYEPARQLLKAVDRITAMPTNAWALAGQTLGLVPTQPSLRPRMGLFGSDLTPAHFDGLYASEKLTLAEATTRLTLPVLRTGGNPWVGAQRIVTLKEGLLDGVAYGVTISVEPEDPGDIAAFALLCRSLCL